MIYDYYNREERALCAHLFRLLHDLVSHRERRELFDSFLKQSGYTNSVQDAGSIRIYCEVALIRDAYHVRKADPFHFMDQLVQEVINLKDLNNCRLFSELDEPLNNPLKTHPKQILRKARDKKISLTKTEDIVYGFIQAIFNSKPDLAIMFDNVIVAYEAKYTQKFNDNQTRRTEKIANIWSHLLYEDLGFKAPPEVYIATIGPQGFESKYSKVSWEWIFQLAEKVYNKNDLSYKSFEYAVKYIADMIVRK